MQPRPRAETVRPERPRLRVFIAGFLSFEAKSEAKLIDAVTGGSVPPCGPEQVCAVSASLRIIEEDMTPIPAWFERKFEFSFPVELHPNVCARLRGTPARLEEIFRNVERNICVRKAAEKWSAQEHAGHLLDLEPLWIARISDYVTDASKLTAADLTNRNTHEAQHNQRLLVEILTGFRSARLQLVSRAENVAPAVHGRTILHPRMQTPMRLVDHLYFVAEHDDHHLAHIWNLIQAG
jgi:uncharacterized damage-inducible protein DinB